MAKKNYRELHKKVAERPGAAERLEALREQTLAEIGLHSLRLAAGFTQAELAATLDVSQSAISQLEQGRDVKLSTLQAYIEALGAELELTAVFNSGEPDEIKTPVRLAT